MTRSADGRLRSAVRRFTLGSGPLKRRCDRVQVVARIAAVLLVLAAPPLAVLTASATADRLEAVAAAQAAERHRTPATLLVDAPLPSRADTADSSDIGDPVVPAVVLARAGWAAPDGHARQGLVPAHPGSPAGTVVPVWVDRDGTITRPPMDRHGIASSALAMATLPLLGIPAAAWTLYAALAAALDAHRLRRWGSAWAVVAPRWTTRL